MKNKTRFESVCADFKEMPGAFNDQQAESLHEDITRRAWDII